LYASVSRRINAERGGRLCTCFMYRTFRRILMKFGILSVYK
jgi:hypothetical protein